MNQEKIGKFILKMRKEKGLTQEALADVLGVTEKSISNWENGRNMPDLALFKLLCETLGITINELLSGEKVPKEDYQERLEENIVNTINYTKRNSSKQIIPIFIMTIGLLISLFSTIIFHTDSSWSAIYSVLGILAFILGTILATSNFSFKARIILPIILTIIIFASLLGIDYINVEFDRGAPMYRIKTFTAGSITVYDTLFYDVYVCPRSKINDNRRVFYPNIYRDTKERYIAPNSKYNNESTHKFCNNKAEERLKFLFENLYKTSLIVVSKRANNIEDEKTYTLDFLYQKYEIVKEIDNPSEIKNIINSITKAKYTEVINDIGRPYLFQLFDKDNYEIAEFNLGEIYDGYEVLGIYLDEENEANLNKYFE